MKHPVAGRTIWSRKCKEKCESKGETSRDRMWVDVLGSGGHARRERERFELDHVEYNRPSNYSFKNNIRQESGTVTLIRFWF